jgi:phosphate transport system protein
MTRTAFERQLADIQEDMLVLAGMVESAIDRGVRALKDRDVGLARQIIADDLKVNRKRYDIEEKCVELLATQQPLAGDLRTIVAVLHIIVDLERMGDYAEGIGKIALMLADEPPLKPYIDAACLKFYRMLAGSPRPSRTDAGRAARLRRR